MERRSELQVGFHSPVEPRHISPSELFDDNKPWSSNEVTFPGANQIESFENSTNQKLTLDTLTNQKSSLQQLNKEGEGGYSDESFASSGTISDTSSVSLPQVSFTASSSPLKMDDTIQNTSARSFKSDPRRSAQSTEQRRSSTSVKPSPQGSSHRGSVISHSESPSYQRKSGRTSKSMSRNSQRSSPSISSASTVHNSNTKEESVKTNTDSSANSHASSGKSRNSEHSNNRDNRDNLNNSSVYSYDGEDRVSPDFPKKSSHSPIKSNKFQKRNKEQHQHNILNVTIPTAALLGSVQTTSSFPDSNSESSYR